MARRSARTVFAVAPAADRSVSRSRAGRSRSGNDNARPVSRAGATIESGFYMRFRPRSVNGGQWITRDPPTRACVQSGLLSCHRRITIAAMPATERAHITLSCERAKEGVMGQSTPVPQFPDRLIEAIQELCFTARQSGRLIDIAEDSARLLGEFPDSGLSEADIGEALLRESVQHKGLSVKLNSQEA
jgi:hypothetical protein